MAGVTLLAAHTTATLADPPDTAGNEVASYTLSHLHLEPADEHGATFLARGVDTFAEIGPVTLTLPLPLPYADDAIAIALSGEGLNESLSVEPGEALDSSTRYLTRSDPGVPSPVSVRQARHLERVSYRDVLQNVDVEYSSSNDGALVVEIVVDQSKLTVESLIALVLDLNAVRIDIVDPVTGEKRTDVDAYEDATDTLSESRLVHRTSGTEWRLKTSGNFVDCLRLEAGEIEVDGLCLLNLLAGSEPINVLAEIRNSDFPVSRATDIAIEKSGERLAVVFEAAGARGYLDSDAVLAVARVAGGQPDFRQADQVVISGSGQDSPRAVAFAPDGDIVIGGKTTSRDFPVVDAVQEHHLAGTSGSDGFVTKLSVASVSNNALCKGERCPLFSRSE